MQTLEVIGIVLAVFAGLAIYSLIGGMVGMYFYRLQIKKWKYTGKSDIHRPDGTEAALMAVFWPLSWGFIPAYKIFAHTFLKEEISAGAEKELSRY